MNFSLTRALFLVCCCIFCIALTGRVSAEVAPERTTVLTVDREDDLFEACTLNGLPCPHCTDGDSNDCTLRWAVEEANAMSTPVEIRFADGIEALIDQRPITVTADDLLISGGSIKGQNVARGLIIEGNNFHLDTSSLDGFSREFVSITDDALNAVISGSVFVGSACLSNPLNSPEVGIYITGAAASGTTKAYLYNNLVACMTSDGMLIDGATQVFIGRKPGFPNSDLYKNTLQNNEIGIRVTNACRVYEDHSEVTDNAQHGIQIGLSGACRSTVFEPGLVANNGGHGILTVNESGSSVRILVAPKEVHSNGLTPIALGHIGAAPRPNIFFHSTTLNRLAVSFSVASDEILIYKLDGDPEENGSGIELVDKKFLTDGQVNYFLYLNDYPTLTTTTTGFMMINGVIPGVTGYTSPVSHPYAPSSPTAVQLAQPAALSHMYGSLLFVSIALIGLGLLSVRLVTQRKR